MTLAVGKLGGKPGVHDLQGQGLAHDKFAHGHHVGVVMLPGQPGAHQVGKQSAADAA